MTINTSISIARPRQINRQASTFCGGTTDTLVKVWRQNSMSGTWSILRSKNPLTVWFSLLLTAIVVSGCLSSTKQNVHFPDQSKPTEGQAKARIYVIRRPLLGQPASYGVPIEVFDGDTDIGRIVGRTFLCWEREPGSARIHTGSVYGNVLAFSADKQRVYYVIQHTWPNGWGAGAAMVSRFELVAEKDGQRELKKCKPPSHTE